MLGYQGVALFERLAVPILVLKSQGLPQRLLAFSLPCNPEKVASNTSEGKTKKQDRQACQFE